MSDFKHAWTLELAMAVLAESSVDSKTWAEAVEWLLLYGPAPIKDLLLQASSLATGSCFPGLRPAGVAADGQVCYDVDAMAEALGISREEAILKMAELEELHGLRQLYEDDETSTVQ